MEWFIIIVLVIAVLALYSRLNGLREELTRVARRLNALEQAREHPEGTPARPASPLRERLETLREQEHRAPAPTPAAVTPPPVVIPPPVAPATPPAPAHVQPISAPQPAPTPEPQAPVTPRPVPTFTFRAEPTPPVEQPADATQDDTRPLSAFRQAQHAEPPTPPAPPATPTPPPPPPRRGRTRAEWEELIGGNWLNRIGILAVIFGMGFLLKFAYDEQWVIRDLLAAVTGLLFLWGGRHFHRKNFPLFAHGLLGGGIALLYMSVFAAYNLHHLLHPALAFTLMSAITLGAFAIALRYDNITVSLIGWAGGYLTPMLLHTGQANDIGMLAYLLLLTGGLLAVQVKRDDWAILEPLTLLAVITLYGYWFGTSYTAAKLPLAAVFVTLIWACFLSIDLYRLRRDITTFASLRMAVAIVNAGGLYLGLYLAFHAAGHTGWLGAVTLVAALAYVSIALRQVGRTVAETRYALTAVILTIIATYLQFRAHPFLVVSLWSVEALALLWAGAAWRRAYLWGSGLAVYTLAFILLLNLPDVFTYQAINHFNPVLNGRVLAFLSLAVTLAVGTLTARRLEDGPRELITVTFHYAWTLLLFLLITLETNDFFRHARHLPNLTAVADTTSSENLVLPVLWTVYSLPLVWLGLRRQLKPLLIIGLAVLGIGVLLIAGGGMTFRPIAGLLPVINLRALLMIFVILGLVIQSLWMEQGHESYAWVRKASSILYVCAALLGFELITMESTDAFRRLVAEGVPGFLGVNPAFANHLLLPILWATYSLPLAIIGYHRRSNALLYTGLTVLTVAAGWVAVQGSFFLPRQASAYLPLLNLRMAAFGFVLAAVALHGRLLTRHGDAYPWAQTLHGALRQALAILGFELLTLEIHSTFTMLHAQGYRTLLTLALGLAQAAALAIGWALYGTALTLYGYRRQLLGYLVSGIIITTLAVGTGMITGLFYTPLDRFMPLLNPRAALFALLILALAVQNRHAQRGDAFPAWQAAMPTLYRLIIVVVGFEWLTVGTITYLLKLHAAGVPAVLGLPPLSALPMVLAILWLAYGFGVAWRGLAALQPAVRAAGLAITIFAAIWSAIQGLFLSADAFTSFIPFVNLRAVALAAAILGLLLAGRLEAAAAAQEDRPSALIGAFRVGAALIGFQWLTLEIWQGIGLLGGAITFGLTSGLARLMALAGAWVLYAAFLTWQGRRQRSNAFLSMGFALLCVAMVLGIITGFQYDPIESFQPVANYRMVMFAAVISSLLLHLRWARAGLYPWMPVRTSIFAVAIAALLFQCVSMEIWHTVTRMTLSRTEHANSLDLRQMALSLGWIIYAVLLSGYGFWRRLVALRVMALAIYLIAIGKIFFYDLRYLGERYLIISLFGLGAVLIITSYIYQRYRHLIIGGMAVSETTEETDHA